MTARPKAWVCDHSLAGIADSNPAAAWISAYLSVVFSQVEASASGWSLVRGSPTECSVSAWVWQWRLDNEEALPTKGCCVKTITLCEWPFNSLYFQNFSITDFTTTNRCAFWAKLIPRTFADPPPLWQRFNTLLPSLSVSPKWSNTFKFPTKTLYLFVVFHVCYTHCPSCPCLLNRPNSIC